MPNETIVQYILNVDTGKAEKGLKDTSRASKQTEQSFDQVGQATTKMNAKLKGTEQQAKRTGRGFRNLRRAGRDLDGAFADLGQGIGIINPAAGNLFMTLSSGASIAEGLGRSLMLFVNPAFVAVAAVTAAAATALFFFNEAQKEAETEAKRVEEVIKQSTQAIEQQSKAFAAATDKMASYATTLEDAKVELLALTGRLTGLEVATRKAKIEATRYREEITQASKDQISSLEKQIEAQRNIVREANTAQRLARERAQQTGTFEFIRTEEEGKRLSAERKAATAAALRERQELADLRTKLKILKANSVFIESEADAMEEILIRTAEVNEQKKQEGEIERKNAKFRDEQNKKLQQQKSAAEKLQGIINKLTIGELTGREKILAQYEQELAVIEKLGETSDDLFAAVEAETLLREKRDRLLDEELRKEQEKLSIIKEQGKEAVSLIASTVQALRSPEAFVSGLGGIVGQVGGVFGSAGTAAAGAAISTAAPAVTAIAGFGGLIQQAIDESDVSLDENQARRVVLGNMNEAFQNFSKDFERGIELLPETIIRVLPEFIVSLGKVLTVDVARVIAVDLPVAILRALPEIIIAIINEVAFLLADLVNGFKLALDQFTSFIQSMFTREGRRDAVASSIDGLKRVLETRFDGVGALRESVSAFAGGGSFIPQAAGGMRYTGNQRSGLAMLHQGEFVVPQSGMRPQSVDRQMSRSGGSPINIVINSPVVEQNAVDALVRRIEERFNSNFGLASSNLFGGR